MLTLETHHRNYCETLDEVHPGPIGVVISAITPMVDDADTGGNVVIMAHDGNDALVIIPALVHLQPQVIYVSSDVYRATEEAGPHESLKDAFNAGAPGVTEAVETVAISVDGTRIITTPYARTGNRVDWGDDIHGDVVVNAFADLAMDVINEARHLHIADIVARAAAEGILPDLPDDITAEEVVRWGCFAQSPNLGAAAEYLAITASERMRRVQNLAYELLIGGQPEGATN